MLDDVRYALRLLGRSPGFTAAAVLTLALGIGATTAIFTVVEAVLLRPLPIDEPDRVVTLHAQDRTTLRRGFSYQAFLRYREQTGSVFESVAASGVRSISVRTDNGSRMTRAAFVSGDFFRMAGVEPARGRGFTDDEHALGAAPAVIVTDAFWRSQLAADPAAIGRPLRVAAIDATIVGVAPRGFRGLQLSSPADLFIPLALAHTVLPAGNYMADTVITIDGRRYSPQLWLDVSARLRRDVPLAQAEAVAAAIVARPDRPEPSSAIRLLPTSAVALGPRTKADTTRFTALLGLVVALVLLLGCANLSGLILARQEQRRREIAVRLALGSGGTRLARLFLAESLLLSLFGALAGMLVAAWMLQVMQTFVIPGGVNLESLQLGVNARVAWFAAGAALFTTVVTGLMPAIAGTRVDVVSSLKAHNRAAAPGRPLARSVLVATQVAIALALLVAGGLFVRSLQIALATDVGTDAARLAYANVPFASAGYDVARVSQFYEAMLARLQAMPGIERATFGTLPLASGLDSTPAFRIEGVNRTLPDTLELYCGPGYFAATGLPLASGRAFGPQDRAQSPPVVIVSEAFARIAWPGENPIGRVLSILPDEAGLEVVGVARDAKFHSLSEQGSLAIYLPWAQHAASAARGGTLIVRSGEAAHAALPALLSAIRAIDPSLPVAASGTLEDRIGALAMTQRLGASFLSWFSALALALTVLGVYGLIACSVARRTTEIGIRLALGAEPGDVVAMIMRRAVAPVAAGIVAGLGGGYAITRLTSSFLFGVAPHDVVSFAAATLILGVAAAAASYIPARRAARIDTMVALRAE